jgi:Co/Zn/Cd efflux system component
VTALLFARGRKGDLNVKGAFLHMAADAAVSAGVVVSGLVILLTGWAWLDPAVSLAILALILFSTTRCRKASMPGKCLPISRPCPFLPIRPHYSRNKRPTIVLQTQQWDQK